MTLEEILNLASRAAETDKQKKEIEATREAALKMYILNDDLTKTAVQFWDLEHIQKVISDLRECDSLDLSDYHPSDDDLIDMLRSALMQVDWSSPNDQIFNMISDWLADSDRE